MRGGEQTPFHIGLIQMACSPDPVENLEKTVWKIREAAGNGAQIICLRELFQSQYFRRDENPDLFALAEPIAGPTTAASTPVLTPRTAGSTRQVLRHSHYCRGIAGLTGNLTEFDEWQYAAFPS